MLERVLPTLAMLAFLCASVQLAGCATSNRGKFRDVSATAPTQDAAVIAAQAALQEYFQGVRIDRKGSTLYADPLYVDFGESELDMFAKSIEQPVEITQALGRVRRTPSIKVVESDGRYGFKIRVEREVEELEAGYVAYDDAYDFNQSSSMTTDPSRYGDTASAPPKSTWVAQGNDLQYENALRAALERETGGN